MLCCKLVACNRMGGGCTHRQGCAPFGSRCKVSAPCRNTALHLASSNGNTAIVNILLEKGADVNATNNLKCAFCCCLYRRGEGCTHQQGCAPFGSRLSVFGAMQVHSAASRIFQWQHGEREGAAREGRRRESREQPQVRVFLLPVSDGRRLHAPAQAVRPFRLKV